MTYDLRKEIQEIDELIEENKRLQEKYPNYAMGLQLGLESLKELRKEMQEALNHTRRKKYEGFLRIIMDRFIIDKDSAGIVGVWDTYNDGEWVCLKIDVNDYDKLVDKLNELNKINEENIKIINRIVHNFCNVGDIKPTLSERLLIEKVVSHIISGLYNRDLILETMDEVSE